MKRGILETLLGAVVLVAAAFFLIYGAQKANVSTGTSGYIISANFSGIGGLKPGDDVQISGVKVGTVSDVTLDSETYLAKVSMMIKDDIQVPYDTAALISSESLLGGRYLALEPGGSEDMLESGDVIEFTQAPQNLEQLLGQFIFSMQKSDDGQDKGASNETVLEPTAAADLPDDEISKPY